MNRICFLIFYFLVLFQIENEVIAQREKRIFERLTIENGLPSNIVSSLYLDKKGFLWVSTNDAISRYDGYGFLNLRNDPFDSTSLPPGHGTKIYQEKNLNLFIQSHFYCSLTLMSFLASLFIATSASITSSKLKFIFDLITFPR